LRKKSLDQLYTHILKKFCKRFEKSVEIIEKQDGHKTAYVFLFNRGINVKGETGLVDVASNLKTEALIHLLQAALDVAKDQLAQNDKE